MTAARVLTVERINYIRKSMARHKIILKTSYDEEIELCDLALAYLEEHPELRCEDDR
jgi:hypothetical protein